MTKPSFEIWIELASTYSHVAVHVAERAAAARGVGITWRTFLLGPIFRAQGWGDSPFNLYPVKGAYMWRDMERLCGNHGIPFRRPSQFPRNGLLAARVVTAAEGQPWLGELLRGLYRANFAEDRDIADPGCVRAVLAAAGCDAPDAVLAEAGSDRIKHQLRERTEEARRRGVFGAPSILVGDELFWGQDRIDDALTWYLSRAGQP
jgi:2-hydroxychromene-2-carboxylate isomerase